MARKPHVALIVETSSAYGQQILAGVNRYLRSHEPWSIFLEQRALTSSLPRWLKDWRGSGIISRATTRELIRAARASQIPIADLTDRHGDLGLPHIWSDNEAIGRVAAEHLLDRGFRNLAFCGFSREFWSNQRLQGFFAAFAKGDGDRHVYESPWHGADAHPWEDEQQELADWLASLPKPVGIMACNDVRGQHVLDACSRTDLAVPEEVAVVGCDNEEILCDLCNPPLSSVMPNAELIGFLAAQLLEQLMDRGKTPPNAQLVQPLGVAVRQSSDVLAVEDPDVAAALRYIREHACEGATVSQLLANVPLSRSILERRFRKYVGRSPQAVIRQTQLKKVQSLLVQTDLSLSRISELAGYKHTEHMCVVFKREVGQTPGAYRKQAQG